MHALLAGLSVYCLAIYYMKRREREVGLYAFQAAQPKLEAAAGITLFPSCLVHPKIETKKRKEKKRRRRRRRRKTIRTAIC